MSVTEFTRYLSRGLTDDFDAANDSVLMQLVGVELCLVHGRDKLDSIAGCLEHVEQ